MPKAGTKDYLLKGIPLDVYQQAQEKAAAHRPPLSMRWVLITLLEKWINYQPVQPEGFKKGTEARKAKKAAAAQTPAATAPAAAPGPQKTATPAPAAATIPDLGESF